MADIQTILNASPAFAQAVQGAALARRVDELEAEKAAVPVCGCMQNNETKNLEARLTELVSDEDTATPTGS
jgi:hypothetical protein